MAKFGTAFSISNKLFTAEQSTEAIDRACTLSMAAYAVTGTTCNK
jgi:hypothetical protein